MRGETDNNYGDNYLQAEAIIAKLMQHYNEERLHGTYPVNRISAIIWSRDLSRANDRSHGKVLTRIAEGLRMKTWSKVSPGTRAVPASASIPVSALTKP